MLKIKDNVDLKELEKFGFTQVGASGGNGYAYDFIPYNGSNSSYLLITPVKIDFDYVDDRNMDKLCELLYDLIKADMVEKEEE